MKKVFLLVLMVLGILSKVSAQAKLKSITYYCNGQKTRAAVTNYDYLTQRTLVTSWSYYTNGRITKPSKCEWLYNVIGQKVVEKYNFQDNWFIGESREMENQRFFQYDTKGCLIEDKTIRKELGKTPFNITTITYKRNANCQLSEVIEANDYPLQPQFNAMIKDKITTYQYDKNDSIIRINYRIKDSINDSNFDQYERSPNGKVKTLLMQRRYFSLPVDAIRLEKRVYEYDANDKLISETQAYKSQNEPDFKLHNTKSYFYNAKGLLSREVVNYKDNPSKCSNNETLYTYDCDNLLIEKVIKYIEAAYCQSEFTGKYVYSYTDVQLCEDAPFSDILVFPNPTNGLFTIESPMLTSGDWRIKIYDNNGKTRTERLLDARSSAFYIFDEHLSTGVYWMQLTNGKNTVNKKLIVAH